VSYRIQVPVGTDLELSTTNGGISVTGVRAAVEVRSTNGGIRLEDVEGSVRARTTNGGVQAFFSPGAALRHDTDLQTTNGAVSLHLPEAPPPGSKPPPGTGASPPTFPSP
jgi:ferric-dicitrate binding protein FerR (iron transport regulator)